MTVSLAKVILWFLLNEKLPPGMERLGDPRATRGFYSQTTPAWGSFNFFGTHHETADKLRRMIALTKTAMMFRQNFFPQPSPFGLHFPPLLPPPTHPPVEQPFL